MLLHSYKIFAIVLAVLIVAQGIAPEKIVCLCNNCWMEHQARNRICCGVDLCRKLDMSACCDDDAQQNKLIKADHRYCNTTQVKKCSCVNRVIPKSKATSISSTTRIISAHFSDCVYALETFSLTQNHRKMLTYLFGLPPPFTSILFSLHTVVLLL